MKIQNQNLPEHIYNIIINTINEHGVGVSKDHENDKTFGFILLDKIELQDRILLRRMFTDHIDYIIIISSNPKLAQFAWKIGAFHFMEFPFTQMQLKLLKQKYEEAKASSKHVNKKIRLGYMGGYDFIPLNEINLILGQGDYVTIYRQANKSKTYTYRISKLDRALENHLNFIKLTKSITININNVAQIIGNQVKFTGNSSTSAELSSRATRTLKDELLWINI